MTPFRKFSFSLVCASFCGTASLYAEENADPRFKTPVSIAPQLDKAQENWIFEVPGLGALSPKHYSWAFVRNSKLWVQNKFYDLAKIEWPKWDPSQQPLALLPPGQAGKWHLIIYDSEKKELEQLSFVKPFQPEIYRKEKFATAEYFAVAFDMSDRISVRSHLIAWPKRKSIFKCEFQISAAIAGEDLEAHRQLRACMTSLSGLPEEKNQWFVEFEWPKFENGDARRASLKIEREFGVPLKKAGHIYVSSRSEVNLLRVLAGRTLVEDLKPIEVNFSGLGSHQFLQKAPEPKLLRSDWISLKNSEDAKLEIATLAVDAIASEALLSPAVFEPRLWVQFSGTKFDGESSVVSESIRQTDFPQAVSGVSGLFRPWYVQGSILFNSLQSSRQEISKFLAFGAIEARRVVSLWDGGWVPRLYLERDLVHLGSGLAITELQMTVQAPMKWLHYVAPYAGLIGYSLGGTNPGSTRLGGVFQGVAGFNFQTTAMPFLITSRAGLAMTVGGLSPQFGADSQVQASYLLNPESREGLFVGFYLGYSTYAAKLFLSATNTQEVFSERRLRAGLSFGWAGNGFIDQ